jgi:hypothetical protein
MMGGGGVPTVLVACSNCGHLMQHAIGALGLLPSSHTSGG